MAKTSTETDSTTDDAKVESKPATTAGSEAASGSVKSSSQSKDDSKTDTDKSESSLTHDTLPRELSLRTFLRICGESVDQTAGFARYAELNKPGRFKIQDWKDALSSFKSTPVR